MFTEIRHVDTPRSPPARPEHQARLDAARYTSGEFMAREWNGVWRRAWLLAGLEQDIAEPGDFFCFDIGRESIIVSRDDSGTPRALYNVCQHRGNRISTLPFGSAMQFACPYHGWRYALDGRLTEVPDHERFAGAVSRERHSLKPLRVECRAGLVWVNMDPQAVPIDDYLAPILDELAPYRLERMRLVRDQSVLIDANWKTVIDNFSEVYHVDFIHEQHASFVDCRDARVDLFPWGHNVFRAAGYVTNPRYPLPELAPPILAAAMRAIGLDPEQFRGRVGEVRAAAQQRKRALGPELGFDYSALSDEQLSDIWQYNLFPNVIMTVKPEEVWIMRPRPHPSDPDRCIFDKWTLAMPFEQRDSGPQLVLLGDPEAAGILASGERPARSVFTQEDVNAGRDSMTITIDQDIFWLPAMQAGMHSAGFDAATINEDECRIRHFHDWMDQWLR